MSEEKWEQLELPFPATSKPTSKPNPQVIEGVNGCMCALPTHYGGRLVCPECKQGFDTLDDYAEHWRK